MERFKEIKELGSGGFGKTLLVEDLCDKNRRIVLKIPHSKMDFALVNEFKNLYHLQASVDNMEHPNIVKYLGECTFQDRTVLMLEYIEGQEVRKIIGPMFHNRPPLELNRALRITMDACCGLVAAHKYRVFHSDIKPDNIMVRKSNGVGVLIDFGISTAMRTTAKANLGGTTPYMAPEALDGSATFSADIWSLSVTLYELVTGNLPFLPRPGEDVVESIKAAIRNDDPIPPKRLNPKIDELLSSLILRGLEKKPANRFQKAQEMLTALETYPKDYINVEIDKCRELIKAGKEVDAEALLQNIIKRFPAKADCYLLLGGIYARRQKPGQAEQILRTGITRCPKHAVLYLNLAMVLNDQKKRNEAIDTMRKAAELDLGPLAPTGKALLKAWQGGK